MSVLAYLRPLVVRTRRSRVLREGYRAIHEASKFVLLARLDDNVPDATLVVRERRVKDRFEAGISDVDIVAVVDGDVTTKADLGRAKAIIEHIARARRGLPISIGTHIFHRDELAVGASLGDTFVAVLQTYGRPADVLASLPRALETSTAARLAAVQVLTFNTLRAARHALGGDGIVDRALVAHALAKADSVRDVAAGVVATTPSALAATYGDTDIGYEGSARDVVAALARLDACLPSIRGARIAPMSAFAHPAASASDALSRWAEPLLRHDAIRSVALLVDSPAALDVRLVIVLDPAAPRADDAFVSLRDHHARHGSLRIHPACPPLRIHVVTPRILARPGCVRLASLEPWLRASAIVAGAQLPAPNASADELMRNVALGLMFACSDARERADREPSATELARAHALIYGVLPGIRALVHGDELPLDAPLFCADPRMRTKLLDALGRASRELSPVLLDRGRRPLA